MVEEIGFQREYRSVAMICTYIIWIKFIITAIIQGRKSFHAGTRVKEDDISRKEAVTDEKIDDDNRWKRLVLNDLENITFGLIMFWGALIVCTAKSCNLALIILMPIWVLMRILHSVFFAVGKQWPRTIVYILAVCCVAAAGIIGVVDAFRRL